jgi:hypothetical protein
MSEEENEYSYTPPQQPQVASISEGDIVSCGNKDSVNFGVWGEVLEINSGIATIKIMNPEFPCNTGWNITESVEGLEKL